jgi:lauroyl/myristoyl acyltransferase
LAHAADALRPKRFHWNARKARLVRGAERIAGVLPGPAAALLLRAGQLAALAAYFLPGVPLRQACTNLSRLAAERGIRHAPFAIYRRLVAQMRDVAWLYHRLYRAGREAVLPHLHFRPEHERAIVSLLEQDGSVVIAVPHNVGSVLYAMRLASRFPCLVVGKQSKRPESDALMQRFFERLGAPLVLASRHDRVSFTRRLLEALGEGRAIIAPLDRIDHRHEGMKARIFGRQPRFPTWAVRVAAKRKSPILPAWLSVERGEVQLELGQPIREADPERALQELVGQFEDWILRDPGSWAFLADKRWQRALRMGASKL